MSDIENTLKIRKSNKKVQIPLINLVCGKV